VVLPDGRLHPKRRLDLAMAVDNNFSDNITIHKKKRIVLKGSQSLSHRNRATIVDVKFAPSKIHFPQIWPILAIKGSFTQVNVLISPPLYLRLIRIWKPPPVDKLRRCGKQGCNASQTFFTFETPLESPTKSTSCKIDLADKATNFKMVKAWTTTSNRSYKVPYSVNIRSHIKIETV